MPNYPVMCLSCILLLASLVSSRASPHPVQPPCIDRSSRLSHSALQLIAEQHTVGRVEAESQIYIPSIEGFNPCFPGYVNTVMVPNVSMAFHGLSPTLFNSTSQLASPRYVHSWTGFGIRMNSMLVPLIMNDSFLSYFHCFPDPQSKILFPTFHHPLPPSGLWLKWDIIIHQPLSSADGGGWIYVFREGCFVYKVGRSNNVARRAREWKRACRAHPQTWLAAFWTPFAHRTERLVHIALEATCDSHPRIRCACTSTVHHLKFTTYQVDLAGQKIHVEKFIFKGRRDAAEQIIMPIIVSIIATVYQP
ncbi:uncharacterized protein C8R40DRAFT_1070709 [Lentinula edodes]|uniref:uncharacterized protein n=1 Tax=Lentinula edodes TaxID=5353 RepID=UPI001E8E2B06|nr:uncharacterized protein C8R40DRAFT_1070709 [Lentinula edodes]KAH7873873.1 hypothetical protein C8R40DRAFT_1070709 [Lentinula edodes]